MATAVTTTTEASIKPSAYYGTTRGEIVRVILVGLGVGIITPLLGLFIDNVIIEPLFCRTTNEGLCGTSHLLGFYISMVLVAAAATTMLANWSIYRPLLIVLGATVALWGLKKYIDPIAASWVEYGAFTAVLFALSYLLFYWLVRIRHFMVCVIVVALATVAVRWALLS